MKDETSWHKATAKLAAQISSAIHSGVAFYPSKSSILQDYVILHTATQKTWGQLLSLAHFFFVSHLQ